MSRRRPRRGIAVLVILILTSSVDTLGRENRHFSAKFTIARSECSGNELLGDLTEYVQPNYINRPGALSSDVPTGQRMQWNLRPQARCVAVSSGESASGGMEVGRYDYSKVPADEPST